MLTLYFAPGSSSMAPHIALHEVGAVFESRPISFSRKENRDPAYLAINPEGKVPTLLIDGRPLTEVAAILFYVARTNLRANLWPFSNVEIEAQAFSWMSFIASSIHPARRRGEEHFVQAFRVAEHRMGGRSWALDEYSVVDIHLFRLYWRFVNSVHPSPDMFRALHAHYERMMARPAVRRTIELESAIGYELPA
jgi:glutathione S-transferase